jgi:ribosomal protein S27AE
MKMSNCACCDDEIPYPFKQGGYAIPMYNGKAIFDWSKEHMNFEVCKKCHDIYTVMKDFLDYFDNAITTVHGKNVPASLHDARLVLGSMSEGFCRNGKEWKESGQDRKRVCPKCYKNSYLFDMSIEKWKCTKCSHTDLS